MFGFTKYHHVLDKKHGRMSRSVVIIGGKRVSSNKHLILMRNRMDFFLSGCMACAQHLTSHVLPW